LGVDDLVKSRFCPIFVIPAKAGIQLIQAVLDSCFRRSDGFSDFLRVHQCWGLSFLAYSLLAITYCPLPIAHCPLPIAHCPLPIAYCPLLIAHCPLPIAYCLLPIAHCSLLIAHCPLPIAHCPLPIAHCPLLYALRLTVFKVPSSSQQSLLKFPKFLRR